MDIERKNINYQDVIIEKGSAKIKGVLSPPEGMPPIVNVLSVTAFAVASAAAGHGGFMVEGKVNCHVLYLCEMGRLNGYDSSADFSASLPIDGLSEESRCTVVCETTNINYNLFGGDVQFNCVVEIHCCCLNSAEAPAISSITGNCIETCDKTITIPDTYLVTENLTLTDKLDLSHMCDSIPDSNCFCRVKDCHIMGDKAIVNGIMFVEFLTAKEALTPRLVTKQLPFEAETQLPEGIEKITASFVTKEYSVSPSGEDQADVFADVDLCVYAVSEKQHKILADLYSTRQKTDFKTDNIYPSDSAAINAMDLLKLSCKAPAGFPQLKSIIRVAVNPNISTADSSEGCLKVHGELNCSFLCECVGDKLFAFDSVIPLDASLKNRDIMEKAHCCLSIGFRDTVAIIEGEGINIQTCLDACIVQYDTEPVTLITNVTSGEKRGGLYGPVVYFPSAVETHWDVCKRFGLSREEMNKLNPEAKDSLPPAILINLRRG